MSRGPEMKIHEWFKNQCKKRYKDKFEYVKSPAGAYSSRAGISDFICCVYGYFIAVEVKVENRDPTLIQRHFLDSVKKAGGLGLCLRGKDEAVFQRIDEFITSRSRK